MVKHVLKIVAVGTVLGALLLAIQKSLSIDEAVFLRGYWIAAAVILAGAVIFNVLYNLSYQRNIRRASALLEAGKPEEFAAAVEKMLQTAKGRALRTILRLDLAAGYMDAKQYERAIQILEELSGSRLLGSAGKLVHRLNLCMSYFYTAQWDKAMKVYRENTKLFQAYRNSKHYGGYVAAVEILAAAGNRQYERAGQLLAAAQESWKDPRLQNAFQELGGLLDERRTRPV